MQFLFKFTIFYQTAAEIPKTEDEDLWGSTDENINDLNYSKAGVTVEEDEIIFRYYNK